MATQAKSAVGTTVTFGGVVLDELRNATDIGFTLSMAAVDAHDGAGWGVSIPTLKRGKPITLELNNVPGSAGQISLRTAALNSTSVVTVVTLPTATGSHTITFNSFVGDYGIPSTPVDGALPLRVQLMPDGAMVYT